MDWELRASNLYSADIKPNMAFATMVYFQFVFAAITLVLIAGSLLGRMNFLAWMAFCPLWLTFSYCVGAYSIWGGGFLFDLGVLDYSGGYVSHTLVKPVERLLLLKLEYRSFISPPARQAL